MEQKSNGALISSIVIVILLIVGGIFFWKTNIKGKMNQPAPSAPTTDNAGTTDDVSSIEADLNATNYDNLDEGL